MTHHTDPSFLPALVTLQAERTPTQTAFLDGATPLDYATLNARANQVAHYLIARGAGPETRIGVSICRSANFAVAALGILKSGAAYVPLDPSYPEARRTLIASDAGLLLTLSAANPEESAVSDVRAVSIIGSEIQTQAASNPELPAIRAEQLAYVIYTSGSTGVPKGVEVTHGNLRHLVRWHNQAFQITPADRSALIANIGFDAAVWELWPYLVAGATLLVPGTDIIRQPDELRNYILEHRIDVMFAPTLLAEALIQLPWPQSTSLRHLLTGGDTLRIAPPVGLPFSVINNYGPAECTVVSTSGETPQAGARTRIPSIGKPIAGAQIYLLDDQLQEVADGSQGEICIGGAGVARGYLNQPELTAQRFVLRDEDAMRIYRSGDLGCLNQDGSIQFLGRVDQQVKIRGYRIECGEIESALNTLPAVHTSAVVVLDRADHRSLTAYLVPSSGASLSHEALRQALRLHLPAHMIPEQFVRLSQMPLNENGKIDRLHLPAPTESSIIASTDHPQTAVEHDLKEILTELLGVESMDREDDFFMLGGHSFIAAQLIARIRARFGVLLGLRAVFEHPTLAGMAHQIEEKCAVSVG